MIQLAWRFLMFHFGGVTEEVLLDNDRGLVAHHDRRRIARAG
jgi:hypothetical protein